MLYRWGNDIVFDPDSAKHSHENEHDFISAQTPHACVQRLERLAIEQFEFKVSIWPLERGAYRFRAERRYRIGRGGTTTVRANGTLSSIPNGQTQVSLRVEDDLLYAMRWVIVSVVLMFGLIVFIPQVFSRNNRAPDIPLLLLITTIVLVGFGIAALVGYRRNTRRLGDMLAAALAGQGGNGG